MENSQYSVITLDAESFFDEWHENITYSIRMREHGVWGVDFFCNLKNKTQSGPFGNDCVLNESPQDGNALFYQIRACLPQVSAAEESALRQSLIFVDFKSLFREPDFPSSEKCKENAKDWNRLSCDELRENIAARLRWMLEGGDGICVTFEDGTAKSFVPFDKSGNMSRKSMISFIDRNLREAVDRRLLLELDFTRLALIPSKYFAYRGLYLSTGLRIEDDDMELDEESVIVVSDKKVKSEPASFYRSKLFGNGDKEPEKNQTLVAFDGEGLICPSYAELINKSLGKQLGQAKSGTAHSFQIRMPFTKGMLHEVDFDRFFSEYFELDKDNPWYIMDLFEKKRDLRKAKIILSESMFKCKGWLKQALKQDPERFEPYDGDVMAYFFAMMKKYSHALYVTGMDIRLKNNGFVRLNYQFLSTLELRQEEFQRLVEAHIGRIGRLTDDLIKSGLRMPDEEEIQEETDAETEEEEAGVREEELRVPKQYARSRCIRAIAKNPAFLKSTYAKEIIRQESSNLELNLGKGRITVRGEQRYLSNDLLGLLDYLSELLGKNAPPETPLPNYFEARRQELSKHLIYPGRFYMPTGDRPLRYAGAYGFLRNPHLSRNEQCVLTPLQQQDDLRSTYFSKLTGVVMVAVNSIVPMALSGADFDGDLVKIVCEKDVVQAMKRCHEQKGGYFERKLPVVLIPSEAPAPRTGIHGIPFETVIDTFQNQVGQISNLAIKIVRKEYTSGGEAAAVSGADCTITVGLEIDAAKSGKHPEAAIKALKSFTKEQKNAFLEVKETLSDKDKARNIIQTRQIAQNGDSIELYLRKADMTSGRDPVLRAAARPDGEPFFALDKLPYCFLRYLYEKTHGEARKESDRRTEREIMFDFEQDRGWQGTLEKEKLEAVSRIIRSYRRIRYYDQKNERIRKLAKKVSMQGNLITVLRLKFDEGENEAYPPTSADAVAARDLCSRAITEICENVKSRENAKTVIRGLIENDWQYAAVHERERLLAGLLTTADEPPKLTPNIVRLMTDFGSRGYMLFYYAAKEALRQYESLVSLDDIEGSYGDDDLEQDKFYIALSAIYRRREKAKHTFRWIDQGLIQRCRRELEELFGGDMSEALQYVYACKGNDNAGNFLWNIFSWDELNCHIPACADKKGGAEDAQ